MPFLNLVLFNNKHLRPTYFFSVDLSETVRKVIYNLVSLSCLQNVALGNHCFYLYLYRLPCVISIFPCLAWISISTPLFFL